MFKTSYELCGINFLSFFFLGISSCYFYLVFFTNLNIIRTHCKLCHILICCCILLERFANHVVFNSLFLFSCCLCSLFIFRDKKNSRTHKDNFFFNFQNSLYTTNEQENKKHIQLKKIITRVKKIKK